MRLPLLPSDARDLLETVHTGGLGSSEALPTSPSSLTFQMALASHALAAAAAEPGSLPLALLQKLQSRAVRYGAGSLLSSRKTAVQHCQGGDVLVIGSIIKL